MPVVMELDTDITPDVSDVADAGPVEVAEPAEPVQNAPDAPDAPEPSSVFDLDSWDGSVDALPEEIRDLGGAFDKHYTARFQPQLDELAALQKRAHEFESVNAIYEALMAGDEDPRIDQLTTRVAEATVAREAAERALKELQEQHARFQAEMDAREEAAARHAWESFKAQNPKLAENTDLLGELLDEGWDLDEIPSLAALNKKAGAEARRLVQAEGVKPTLAVELARHRHPDTKDTSRSSVVAGSSGPTANAAELDRKGPLNPSYRDRLEFAMNRALRA